MKVVEDFQFELTKDGEVTKYLHDVFCGCVPSYGRERVSFAFMAFVALFLRIFFIDLAWSSVSFHIDSHVQMGERMYV